MVYIGFLPHVLFTLVSFGLSWKGSVVPYFIFFGFVWFHLNIFELTVMMILMMMLVLRTIMMMVMVIIHIIIMMA